MKTENYPMIQLLLSSLTENHRMPPVCIRKPGEDSLIDMDRVYDSDLEYIFRYVTEAYCIDWEKMKKYPFSEYVLSSQVYQWSLPPFWQIIFTQIKNDELKWIEKAGMRLCLDKKIPKKKRDSLLEETTAFLELSRSLLIKHSLVGFLTGQSPQSKEK